MGSQHPDSDRLAAAPGGFNTPALYGLCGSVVEFRMVGRTCRVLNLMHIGDT